jgi:hypothetical protein
MLLAVKILKLLCGYVSPLGTNAGIKYFKTLVLVIGYLEI